MQIFIHENASEDIICEWRPFCPGRDELTDWGRLNKKDRLTGYGDPHVKDKTS